MGKLRYPVKWPVLLNFKRKEVNAMVKPTKWTFSRKRDGYPLEKLELTFLQFEITASDALSWFQGDVDKYGLDDM